MASNGAEKQMALNGAEKQMASNDVEKLMDNVHITAKRVCRVSFGTGGGCFVFPVQSSDRPGSVYIPEYGVDRNTVLQISTASDEECTHGVSPLVEVLPISGADFFAKPIYLKLPIHSEAESAQVNLLVRPNENRSQSEGESQRWIVLDAKYDHVAGMCVASPWWRASGGWLHIFTKFPSQFKLVNSVDGTSSSPKIKMVAVSVFTKCVTSRRVECSIVFHCRHVDLKLLEQEKVILGQRIASQGVVLDDHEVHVVVQGKVNSTQWSLSAGGKDSGSQMLTQVVNFWAVEDLCRHRDGYPTVSFHAQLQKRKISVGNKGSSETKLSGATDDGTSRDRLSEDFTINFLIVQSQSKSNCPTCFEVSIPCSDAVPLENAPPVASLGCLSQHTASEFIPRELRDEMFYYLGSCGQSSRVVRERIYHKMNLHFRGNHQTNPVNLLSYLETERDPDLLKLSADEIMAEFDEPSDLQTKYEKLILPVQHARELTDVLDQPHLALVLQYFEEQAISWPEDLATKAPEVELTAYCAKLMTNVVRLLSDEQFLDFKAFLCENVPPAAVILGYSGFRVNSNGQITALPSHRMIPVKVKVGPTTDEDSA